MSAISYPFFEKYHYSLTAVDCDRRDLQVSLSWAIAHNEGMKICFPIPDPYFQDSVLWFSSVVQKFALQKHIRYGGVGEKFCFFHLLLVLYHTSFDSLRDVRSPTFLKSRGASQTVKINLVNY
ncbi:MAG: hypothetical protein C4323_03045 [Mastigocladus sp. ERB_26_2]